MDLPVPERIALVDASIREFAKVAPAWVDACVRAEGLEAGTPDSAEEWIVGPYFVLRNLRLLRLALEGIRDRGRPRIPGPVTVRPGGQVVARVFPARPSDRVLFMGTTAEIWMEPGVTRATLAGTQAVEYAAAGREGAVALVLGAGNVSSIGPMDALHKLFVEKRVVLLKTHPVSAYLGPLIEEGLASLVREGYLRVVGGGEAEGAYLCGHPGVDEVHVTGSHRTLQAIVFGAGPEGERRRAEGRPLLAKRVTSELGNVSPVIVVPGPWSEADFRYHAINVSTMLANNAGFNCNAARVIVQHAGWAGRERLLAGIRRVLSALPPRVAYYPGARARFESFLAVHPEAERHGAPGEGRLPWTLIPALDPDRRDEICFTTEAFCSVFGETAIPARDVPEFLDRAVAFANERLWGTLNVTLLVHPAVRRDPRGAEALDRAIASLRYGTVALNHWAALGFGLGVTTWGAFPGHELRDPGSGTGVVHDTLMFSRVQKSVLRAPFRVWPKPPWFVGHRSAHRLFEKLSAFEASPSIARIAGVVLEAMRG